MDAQLQRADVMVGLGRHGEAISLLAQVVAAQPDHGEAWGLLAQAQLAAGKPEEGLAAARRAVELSPASAWPHRLLSAALQRTGSKGGSLESAYQACRLEPHHWINHLSLAQAALAARGYVGEGGVSSLTIARQASAAARALGPGEPAVHYVSGQVSRACGDQQGAAEHFKRTLALDPEHSNAVNELGRISLDRGAASEAARHFIQAARIAPDQLAYGHNVDVAVARAERSVRQVVRWIIYGSWLLVILALDAQPRSGVTRAGTLGIVALVALAIAVFWQVQLRRMPQAARPLFQSRSMLLALGIALGSLTAGLIAVEFAPERLGSLIFAAVIVMLAARFAAFRILRSGALKRHRELTARQQPSQ